MGVTGLTTFLQKHDWMPKQRGCSISLWRETVLDDKLADRIGPIPPFSTLAIDGNSLAYHIHDVAYARYFNSVTAKAHNNGSNGTSNSSSSSSRQCTCCKKLSKALSIRCLPQAMPLKLVDEVTKEFVDNLLKKQMKLVIYWDGPSRRMKAKTSGKRSKARDEQWYALQQFCEIGVLPFREICLQKFSQNFPRSRLLIQQVVATLTGYSALTQHRCDEEADREVALASATDTATFSLGLDSDYCMFANTKYVPLSTLNATANQVTGCIITREALADYFHLPSSEIMIELAILAGNDYIVDPPKAVLDFQAESVEDAIDHLQLQVEGYQVTSRSSEVQYAIDYTRALYSFGCLTDFPIDSITAPQSEEVDDPSVDRSPRLPESFDLSMAKLNSLEFSFREVVTRTIQFYIDNACDNEPIIKQHHLDSFLELSTSVNTHFNKRDKLPEKLHWENVLASYAIEKCIDHGIRQNNEFSLSKYLVPMELFDQLTFHCMVGIQNQTYDRQLSNNIPEEKDEIAAPSERLSLPIDEFEDEILASIRRQRVTIIQGETGCGKSSRVPVMIMRHSQIENTKIFVSQPRRIAVKSLVERVRTCEPDLKHRIALRMGHGEREYESSETRAWFVTTGYLVRVMANNPERFDDISHLIIDEVHERSIDSDILCLLCRRLLESNPRIRIVLMSATMASSMYAEYFGVETPPIEVGGRRFPIKEFFIEDIISSFKLPAKDKKSAIYIRDQSDKCKCKGAPSNTHMANLYQIAVRVAATVGRPGTSVLIFVSGMNDIVSIIDLVDKLYLPDATYTCFPIHSDVPFEEQMAAFDKPAKDEVKIIIGTNAAESSITLPDVDHVICLGLQKQITYNEASHRQLLSPAWISKASAVQRAGRTGRVRKGNVYRLYTERAFSQYMHKFELGEMSRVPLDSVILDLKTMLEESATSILRDCLEPPDLLNIERSFASLHQQNFLTEPDDEGVPTTLGSFVASMGIDLMLGSLIGLGIQFGVGPEAIEIAAILSFSQTPWIISNPLFHEAPTFNDLASRTFISRNHFDACLYSDPLSIMNVLWDYENTSNKRGFCWHFSLVSGRVRRLLSTRNSIRSRVAEYLGCSVDSASISMPPSRMPHSKAILLRIIQVWVFKDSIIKSHQVASSGSGKSFAVTLRKNQIEMDHLSQVLRQDRHQFKLVTLKETEQKGTFQPVEPLEPDDFVALFQERYLSYCIESGFNMAWYRVDNDALVLFLSDTVAASNSVLQMRKDVVAGVEEQHIRMVPRGSGNNRGRNGRASGLWTMQQENIAGTDQEENASTFVCFAVTGKQKDKIAKLAKYLKIKSLQTDHVEKTISCHLFLGSKGPKERRKKLSKNSYDFTFFLRGLCGPMSQQDIKDLFATDAVQVTKKEGAKATQEVRFKITPNTPLKYKGYNNKEKASRTETPTISCQQRIMNDIPEGARILSILASERRNEHAIFFSSPNEEDDKLIKVELSRSETKIGERWSTLHTGRMVFVETNSIPAASWSMDGPVEVFAVAGDSLELKGGGLRVSGLTVLPPGRQFLLLCMKSFGLHPCSQAFHDEDEELDQCLEFLNASSKERNHSPINNDSMTEKILQAIEFNEYCKGLDEKLVCHPDLVIRLLSIFNLVDGHECHPWDDLCNKEDGSFGYNTNKPGKKKRANNRNNNGGSKASAPKQQQRNTNSKISNTTASEQQISNNNAVQAKVLSTFSKNARKSAKRLFATSLDSGETVKESDFPSTNILSMLIQEYQKAVDQREEAKQAAAPPVPAQWAIYQDIQQMETKTKKPASLALEPSQWKVYQVMGEDEKTRWWSACYIADTIPLVLLRSRHEAWMNGMQPCRPSNVDDAKQCVPPHVAAAMTFYPMIIITTGNTVEEDMIFHPSLEEALRVGAAYWMERQFADKDRHWYMLQFNDMLEIATSTLS
mmetsp:Transcript_15561/g.23901  ORF Transcript_15561/g.23901 Transcript_15561/m.23901 type:complete len:1923 (-) Transcript_15561:159-5927(-)